MIFDDQWPAHERISATQDYGNGHSKTYTLTRGVFEGISITVWSNHKLGVGIRFMLQDDGVWQAEIIPKQTMASEEKSNPSNIIDLENSNFLRTLQEDILRITVDQNWHPEKEDPEPA